MVAVSGGKEVASLADYEFRSPSAVDGSILLLEVTTSHNVVKVWS